MHNNDPESPTQQPQPTPEASPEASSEASLDTSPGSSPTSSTTSTTPTSPTQSTSPSPSIPPADPTRKATGVRGWLSFWLPIVTSTISLIVAITTYVASNQDPDVSMTLPDRILMVQGGNSPAGIYIQPSFVSTGRNNRIDVITDIKLHIEALADQSVPTDFKWTELGTWSYIPETGITYIFQSFKRPLNVSPSNPQSPVCLLQGPSDWLFNAGDYRFTITSTRAVGTTPLLTTFTVNFPQGDVDFINSNNGNKFVQFPIQP